MKRKSRGQALAELALALTFVPVLVSGTVSLARMYLVQMRLHMAARHGAFLFSTRRVEWDVVEEEVRSVLKEGMPQLDSSVERLNVVHERVRVGLAPADKVTVQYKMNMPVFTQWIFWRWRRKQEWQFQSSVVVARAGLF